MRIAVAAFLLAVPFGIASADPLPWPATDYEGEFAVPGPGARPMTVSLRYQSSTRRAAVAGALRGVAVRGVLDVATRKMRLVTDMMPDQVVEFGLSKNKLKTEGWPTDEIREVEGETCRIWTVHASRVCFAEDGIWRLIENDTTTIVLSKIRRTPQPDDAFDVGEKNAQKLPALLQGVKIDGLNPFPF